MQSHFIKVHIALLDRPKCFVLEHNWKITWFSKHLPIWRHTNCCAVLYAHNASSNLKLKSFLLGQTTFSNMDLIFLFEFTLEFMPLPSSSISFSILSLFLCLGTISLGPSTSLAFFRVIAFTFFGFAFG